MGKLQKYVHDPRRLYLWATAKGLTKWVPDEVHLRIVYRLSVGRSLDFENPRGFNEKLQWLKLHDRNPLYTTLVDKYLVKQWVASRIGEQYVTKTYAAWERAEDIDISELPERFVLKTNHDCGGIAICRDRAEFDLDAAKAKLAKHLRRNYYWGGREWPYKHVKPLVFAEEYVEPDDVGRGLTDYKLYAFTNGRIVSLVCNDRFNGIGLKETFFDEEWRKLDMTEGGHVSEDGLARPERFDEMKALARKLAEGIPFVRVDFYESGGGLIFGEMTFFTSGGMEHFNPSSVDDEWGEWIDLSNSERGGGGSL